MTVRIEDWAVSYPASAGPFDAPEIAGTGLVGVVYGHARLPDGKKTRTSRVVAAEGRRVTTESGTVYELGEPSPAYLAWLAQRGWKLDDVEPLKVRR